MCDIVVWAFSVHNGDVLTRGRDVVDIPVAVSPSPSGITVTITTPVNWWPTASCARAFWGQQDCRPYQDLLADTLDWAAPAAGERWLDLGCGGGAVTRAICDRTGGRAVVTGVDCAAANGPAFDRIRAGLDPRAGGGVEFVHHDFSAGLDPFPAAAFDHAVSGLAVSYAESFDPAAGRWTTAAYDGLLAEVRRVLRPGGRFVFSVNVPEPSWARVVWKSLPGLARRRLSLRFLGRAARMLRYGRWLKREARAGRFHFLPAADVARRLAAAGFTRVEHRLSYADQAFVFRAVTPG